MPPRTSGRTRKRALDVDTTSGDEHGAKAAKLGKTSDIRGFFRSKSSESDEADPQPKSAKKKTASSNKAAKPTKKAADTTKNSQKQYKAAVTSIDKVSKELARRMKPNPGMFGVTSDTYAKAMARFLPDVEKLLVDSPEHAFNLLMYIGEKAHADLDYGPKMCGFGDTDEPYKKMDQVMVRVIDKRVEADGGDVAESMEQGHDEGNDSEDELKSYMEELGGKRPNKSERNRINKLRQKQEAGKIQRAKLRRETTKAWVPNALRDLVVMRDYLDQYGIGKHYFHQSIAKLEEFKSPGQLTATVA
ncbi:uncharacterized protein K441DRAFT_665556 [Cenococcum geophilum 1.58]|uniref:uncharacterized protein n=1 Tax=Cenococcum geophilum 1.58 TaxID=794803 RepID=UPI00358F50D4|nr:hypothetical protein K441DRAFT_665556 [Cenococcum geophilum 1.58]